MKILQYMALALGLQGATDLGVAKHARGYLKTCACGKGYNHRGFQCTDCHKKIKQGVANGRNTRERR